MERGRIRIMDRVLVAHSDRRYWATVIEPHQAGDPKHLRVTWPQRAKGQRIIAKAMVVKVESPELALAEYADHMNSDHIVVLSHQGYARYSVEGVDIIVAVDPLKFDVEPLKLDSESVVYFDAALGLYWSRG